MNANQTEIRTRCLFFEDERYYFEMCSDALIAGWELARRQFGDAADPGELEIIWARTAEEFLEIAGLSGEGSRMPNFDFVFLDLIEEDQGYFTTAGLRLADRIRSNETFGHVEPAIIGISGITDREGDFPGVSRKFKEKSQLPSSGSFSTFGCEFIHKGEISEGTLSADKLSRILYRVYCDARDQDVYLDPRRLNFDIENPRLAEYGLDESTDENTFLSIFIEGIGIEDVIGSLAVDGYWNHQQLLVERKNNGDIVVREGNRRLAGLMVLLDDDRRMKELEKIGLKGIDASVLERLRKVPCNWVKGQIELFWRYFSFKHLRRSLPWTPYGKGYYLDRILKKGHTVVEVSAQIGFRAENVKASVEAFRLMKEVDDSISKNPTPYDSQRLKSLLQALTIAEFREFLHLPSKVTIGPFDEETIARCSELLNWVCGENYMSIPEFPTTEFPRLIRILEDPAQLQLLREGRPSTNSVSKEE